MTRGPAPTPTAILKARDSWRADRPDEPTATGEPVCPKGTPAKLKAIFDRIAARMKSMNIGGEVDTDLLLEYCRALLESEQVEAALKKEGSLLTIYKRGKAKGEKIEVSVPHPLLRRRDKLREAICRLAQQFGFSPASRARVKTEKPAKADPLEEFLRPKRN